MINIERTTKPTSLDSTNRRLIASSYSNDDVVDALLEMQHHKCCFCEKDLNQIGKSARWVEHFIAKDDDLFKDAQGNTDWNRANEWNNLLYSCSTCNRGKGTDKPFHSTTGRRRLIDPSYKRIDPELHIDFVVDDVIIFYKDKNRSRLGKNTIKNLNFITRHDIYSILRKIKTKIDADFGEVVDALTFGNTIEATSKLADLSRMTSAHKPHAAFCRKYIKQKITIFNNAHLQIINRKLGMQIAPINISIAQKSQVIQ